VSDGDEQRRDTEGRVLPSAAVLRGTARRREDSSSAFVRAAHLSADETSAQLSVALAAVLTGLATNQALAHPTVTPERLTFWHQAVFGGLFKREAGRFRKPHEDVVFSNVYVGTVGEQHQVVFNGAPGRTIEDRLETACTAFATVQRRHAAGSRDVSELAHELARLVAVILRIHPFLDGNHRITLLAMQAVIRDVSGTIMLLPDDIEELGGDLELALLGDDYVQPLADRLARVLT
jgi:fido (protein-threonine AMPylation protein)